MSNRNRTRAVAVASAAAYSALAALTPAASAGATTAPIHARSLSGTLTVFGNTGNNVIVVSRDSTGNIFVNGGAVVVDGPRPTVNNIQQLRIFARAGNDMISLDETNGPLPSADVFGGDDADRITGGSGKNQLSGGAGNDILIGGRGDELLTGGDGADFVDGNQGADTAVLGRGQDAFQWDPGDGSDVVDGDAGHDAMVFNGAAAAELFDVAANGGRVLFTREPGTIRMDLGGVEEIDTRALAGADSFTAHHLRGTDVNLLELDESSAGAPDAVADRVTVDGTDGADNAVVSGSVAQGVVVAGPGATLRLTGTDPVDGLDIEPGQGDDTVMAEALAAGVVSFSADGGDGNDVIVGSAGDDVLHGGAGDDVLTGGPGTDVLDGGTGANVLTQ